jgi:hypothetical protein
MEISLINNQIKRRGRASKSYARTTKVKTNHRSHNLSKLNINKILD